MRRRFINTTAFLKDLELHGFWHRRLETLVVTGVTLHGVHGITTTAFWLSLCRQLDVPTSLLHRLGPAQLASRLFQDNPAAEFRYCVEYHADGTVLFRAPRVTGDGQVKAEPTQEGRRQGLEHSERHDQPRRQVTSSAADVPPCRRAPRFRGSWASSGSAGSAGDGLRLRIPRPSRN